MFSKRNYNNIFYINNGGWHFTNIKSPTDIEKKLLNYTHHYEFEQSGLTVADLHKKYWKKKLYMIIVLIKESLSGTQTKL